MKISEIFDEVLTDSGQYVITPDKVELREERFINLVKRVLSIYNKYFPITKRFNIEVPSTSYDFTGHPDGVPVWVAGCVPVLSYTNIELHSQEIYPMKPAHEFPYEYNRPKLWVAGGGRYEIHACYGHEVTHDTSDVDSTKHFYEISTLDITDDHQYFWKYLVARFLIGLGGSRRAFTLNELNITMDGESLVSEGREQERELLEQMSMNGRWDLNYIG